MSYKSTQSPLALLQTIKINAYSVYTTKAYNQVLQYIYI